MSQIVDHDTAPLVLTASFPRTFEVDTHVVGLSADERRHKYLNQMYRAFQQGMSPQAWSNLGRNLRQVMDVSIGAEHRDDCIHLLRCNGMSVRAIAATADVSIGTVHRCLNSRYRRTGGPYMYAIGAVGSHRIKIGRTVDPVERLNQLQVGSPLTLVLHGFVIETIERNEASEHRRLAARRAHGEWFDITTADLPWLEVS